MTNVFYYKNFPEKEVEGGIHSTFPTANKKGMTLGRVKLTLKFLMLLLRKSLKTTTCSLKDNQIIDKILDLEKFLLNWKMYEKNKKILFY